MDQRVALALDVALARGLDVTAAGEYGICKIGARDVPATVVQWACVPCELEEKMFRWV